jgi:hypothetical protein
MRKNLLLSKVESTDSKQEDDAGSKPMKNQFISSKSVQEAEKEEETTIVFRIKRKADT